MKQQLFIILLFLGMIGCIPDTPLEISLKLAGNNRKELEKVLQLYKGDSLKYQAACFLIENMIYYQYREGPWVDTYYKYYALYATRKYTFQEVLDKVNREDGGLNFKQWKNVRDIEVVDSAYLVTNIEWAFKVWEEQPWGKNISFDKFCEEILPYRIEDEKLPVWREKIYNKYNHLLDDFRRSPDSANHFFAAKVLIDTLSLEGAIFTGQLPAGPHLGPQTVEWRSGTCRDFCGVWLYIMRALGIPCGIDYMVVYGDLNQGHLWNYVTDMQGNYRILEFPDTAVRKTVYLNMPKPKVYRRTFSLNRDLSEQLGNDKGSLWPAFRYPLFKDVTPFYKDSAQWDICIPVSDLYRKPRSKEIVYLCCAQHKNWTPVDWCRVSDGKVEYKNIEGNIVFTLGVWNKKQREIEVISDAFHLDRTTGKIRFLTAQPEKEETTLLTKFVQTENFLERMRGGVFEGSNMPDFQKKDTLFYIEEVPGRLYNVAYPITGKKYRYVRYYGPEDGYCDVSEIAFYEKVTDTTPLQGELIVAPGATFWEGPFHFERAFDGDPYTSTSFEQPYGGWLGLDLGEPVEIGKIVYTPRNMDNFIRPGDRYELFYFDKGQWNTLGQQVAVADSVNFDAPVDALLYLTNHTRGKDERIFEYKEGKQCFW